jgi:predicted metal-dependent peptidase
MTQHERINKLIGRMLRPDLAPWYGTIVLHLKLVPVEDSWLCPTMQTNATVLEYNPEWVAAQSDEEVIAVLVHEASHCALLHPFRFGSRKIDTANRAMDYEVNSLIRRKYKLPKDHLYEPRFDGPGWEKIYPILIAEERQQAKAQAAQQNQSQQSNESGDGDEQDQEQNAPAKADKQAKAKPQESGDSQDAPTESGEEQADGGGSSAKPDDKPAPPKPKPHAGGCKPAPKPSEQSTLPGEDAPKLLSEEDWKEIVQAAEMIADRAGTELGDMKLALNATRQSKTDWKQELREFFENLQPSDISWASPSRRHIHRGIYLPGAVRESIGHIAIAQDVSGSMGQEQLDLGGTEITSIVREFRPELVTMLYCDSAIRRVQEFTADDEIKLTACGGGGTKFKPVLGYINRMEDKPIALIFFTDLDASDIYDLKEPDYPVIWVTDKYSYTKGPFGKTVVIDPYN